MHDYGIYKMNHPVTSKQVVNVFDLGYLGVEKDFPEQLYPHYEQKEEKFGIVTRRNKLQSGTC